MLFDKTGTLTTGKLAVAKLLRWTDAVSEERLLRVAASAERGSEHPIAAAILAHAAVREVCAAAALPYEPLQDAGRAFEDRRDTLHSPPTHPLSPCAQVTTVEPSDFVAAAGQGLQCVVDGEPVLLGNRSWMTENGLALNDAYEAQVAKLETQGHTVVVSALDASPFAAFFAAFFAVICFFAGLA